METIIFKTRDELFKVNIEKLVYAMADDNYIHLYFHNKQNIMICMNSSDFGEDDTEYVIEE